MRVLVELLDKDPIKNVLGPCIFRPEVAVFLCDTRDSGFFKESAIFRLFKRRKIGTQARFLYFDASDPMNIRRVLAAVVRDYPGCVFDFTGGRDLVLLVAGACFAEEHLPAFYIDIPRQRFINIRGCAGEVERFKLPQFSAEDIFAMAGATIQGHGHFPMGQMDAAFEADALEAFDIVQKNPKAWQELVCWLQGVCAGTAPGTLQVEGPRRLKSGRNTVSANTAVLRHLVEKGLLTDLEVGRQRVRLGFASALHRRCLLIEGVWLELYCYVVAKRSGAFHDVRTSIVVDWDGVEGGADNTKNEVDVFAVQGATPVFISCKMGLPSALALSEIRLLATKFGGSQARAVLLTAGRLNNANTALQARAQDLDILLWDRAITESGGLAEKLAALVRPQIDPDAPRLVDADMLPVGLY